MQRDTGLSQVAHERFRVIALVRTQSQPLGQSVGMAVDRKRRFRPIDLTYS